MHELRYLIPTQETGLPPDSFFFISTAPLSLKQELPVGSCGLYQNLTCQKYNGAPWSTCARLTSKDSKVGVMIEGDRLVAMLFQQTKTKALSL